MPDYGALLLGVWWVFQFQKVLRDPQQLTKTPVKHIKMCTATAVSQGAKGPKHQSVCAEPEWKWARSHLKSASGWFGKEVLAMPAKELSGR